MPSSEISTGVIVENALQQGKKVFVPYLYEESDVEEGKVQSVMDMVSLHSIADFESLQPDKWGIPTLDPKTVSMRKSCFGQREHGETTETMKCVFLDLIIMPGVAFDSERRRLGHGKGFYDSFLTRYEAELVDKPSTEKTQGKDSRMPHLGLCLLRRYLL